MKRLIKKILNHTRASLADYLKMSKYKIHNFLEKHLTNPIFFKIIKSRDQMKHVLFVSDCLIIKYMFGEE